MQIVRGRIRTLITQGVQNNRFPQIYLQPLIFLRHVNAANNWPVDIS